MRSTNDIAMTDLDDVPYDAGRISEESINMPYTTGDPAIEEEKLWFKRALVVCVIAFTITVTSAIVGIAVGVINNSSAFLAFGCDGFVDIFAGTFIIWRFSGHTETKQQIIHIEKKKKHVLLWELPLRS